MTFTQNKWFNALLILALMLGTMGITSAAAKCDPAKSDNCPVEAPGQQVNTDTNDSVVVNNGGQTLPEQAVANGVVKKTDDTVAVPVVNNGGQTLPDNAVANGVINQMEAGDATTAPTSPGVISNAEQGNQTGADCSSLQGVTLSPPAEPITAQQLHDMLNWGWKDGPTGGRNRIRATNVCVSNGGNGQWSNNLPEPANSRDDIASWKKLQRWAELYNAGQLVIFTQ